MNEINAAINQLITTAIHAGLGVVVITVIITMGMFARRVR